MVRTTQTARKSTGGRAPRKQLLTATAARRPPPSWWKDMGNDIGSVDVKSFLEKNDLAAASHKLPVLISNESDDRSADEPSSIVCMPIIDLSDTKDDKDGAYTVSRHTSQFKDSVTKHGNLLLDSVFENAQEKYPDSRWVIIWKNDDCRGYSILPEEGCEDGQYGELSTILEDGKLNGCDLRGNPETNQYGLVSNRKLQSRTFVAVEGGVLWSADVHEDMVKNQGNPLLHLSSNFIPADLLWPLSDRYSWRQYQNACSKACGRGAPTGFVVESSFRGNETKHFDDPGWLPLLRGSGEKLTDQLDPNTQPFLILDLKGKHVTVGYETSMDVPPNTELTVNWGK